MRCVFDGVLTSVVGSHLVIECRLEGVETAYERYIYFGAQPNAKSHAQSKNTHRSDFVFNALATYFSTSAETR